MALFVNLNWQDFEIENDAPVIDPITKKQMKNGEKLVTKKVATGIKMKIKPLSYEANQLMLAFAQKNRSSVKDKDEEVDGEKYAFDAMSSPELPEFIRKIVPPHVKDMEGVEMIGEGETTRRKATVEDIVNNGCFMTIALAIFTKLSTISNLSEEENSTIKKNLGGSSVA